MEQIKRVYATQKKEHPKESVSLQFGTFFTDHMFNMDYSKEKGWHNPRIEPYAPFELSPATMVFHYGQAVFEGLKAYRTKSGAIQLFRPEMNMKRMNSSSRLLCIPEIDEQFAIQAIKELVSLEKDWVPSLPGTSLYIRPAIIATDPYVGVRESYTYRFFIIVCPVGAYYPEGFNPVKILVIRSHVRAVRGGLGEAKTPANYAASLLAGKKAHEEGYTQVLWLDGVEQRYVEEVGSMNIFFVIDGEIITPQLNGSILPGITRDSVLYLAKKWNLPCVERKISIDEVLTATKNGRLTEMFGTGTAAVISPVGMIKYNSEEIVISEGKVGPITQRLYDVLTNIQYGLENDPANWIVPVC